MILAPRHQMVSFAAAACADGAPLPIAYLHAHDPAPPSGRPRRPRLSRRRLVLRLPRLLPVDPAGPEIQLSHGSPADRRRPAVFDQAAAIRPRRRGRDQADASGDHLRQVGELVSPRSVPALQEPTARPSRRSRASVPAHARNRARLRHDPDRAGPLRSGRSHRDLCPPGAREGRRRADHLRRQGPDAAHRAWRIHVRSGVGRSGRERLSRGAEDRRRRSDGLFRRGTRQGDRRSGAGRQFDRQRAGRARHRRQDGRATHKCLRRPRDAARARRRDQAAETARGADQSGKRRPHPDFEATRHARPRRRRRDAARRARPAEARRQGARRLLQGDGAHHDHPPGRRDLRGRHLGDRARPALRRPGRVAGPRRRGGAGARAGGGGRVARALACGAVAAPGAATPADLAPHASGRSEGADRPDGVPDGANPRRASSFDRSRARRRPCRFRCADIFARPVPGRPCRRVARDRSRGSLLHSDRTSHRRGRPLRRPGPRPGPDSGRGRDRALKAADGGAGRPQDRPRREVRHAGLRASRRDRRAGRRHDAHFLRARRRAGGRPRHGRTRGEMSRAQADRAQPMSRDRAATSSALRGSQSTRRRNMPPRTPM